ncbi:MAG TPA: hypothetical protein DF296_03530 [Candidatus Margulisbacteria bacterium]|nr:MAG: hypothetical protein A2X43_02870 [Candidatus Margulisbacteria bacterium GWD2_39_127]OGI05639.1 MAG: hypothetical protein A2X41_12875 [Candidatus Margulisbacteria bacterium GWE2_39_32]HAR64139.1 hypothetical protein [Candidatus Margulisiibacteriota bacterium]HCT84252.1 hypothetical protein [Candidatus Margulisiibacteriota bacterium]
MKKEYPKIAVGFVQISSNFPGAAYLPYAVGCLQAYAQKYLDYPEQYIFLPQIYKRIPVDEAVKCLICADIIGFSSYIWNSRITLAIARELKRLKPQTVIVFGGPHVPQMPEDFLRQNPFIDLVCHGEGEASFCAILEKFPQKKWSGIPGVSYIGQDGTFISAKPNAQIKELSTIPSPYLSGVFDQLIENPGVRWLAAWETNRGCPYSCSYCDFSAALSSKVYIREMDLLRREFEWFADNKIDLVYCTDANFGVFPRDVEIAEFCVNIRRQTGHPRAFMMESSKTITDNFWKIHDIVEHSDFASYAVLSVQTLNDQSLQAIKRHNISLEMFHEVQKRCFREGITTMTDLILGLPEESYDSFVQGVSILLDKGQHHNIQFNNLCILPNSEMGDKNYQEKYDLQLIEVGIVNQHGLISIEGDVPEVQTLVIGSRTMPVEDWIRARAFSWMTSFLFFDKLLQLSIVILREAAGIDYRLIIEFFMESSHLNTFPVLSRITSLFTEKAREITEGGTEYCYSAQWLGIWWPVDEYALIDLYYSGKIDIFYDESLQILESFIRKHSQFLIYKVYLRDALLLTRSALKLPRQQEDMEIELSSNIYQFYQGVLSGDRVQLESKSSNYIIKRSTEYCDSNEEWLRKVVWYQNKIGSYLYPITEGN